MLSLLPHLILCGSRVSRDVAIHQATCRNRIGTRLAAIKISEYESNRNILLSNFISDTEIEFGYYTSSVGQGPDTVYAQGLCRADLEPETCLSCFNDAKTSLPKACKIQKDAFGYYDFCTFHYSNSPMQGKYLDPSFSYSFNNPEDARDATSYTKALNDLLQKLKSDAASGGDGFKVAVGSQTSAKSETVYGLAQCVPDLSQKDCDDCLQNAISQIRACCGNKVGGRVIKYSCNLRFEKIQFYDDM